MTSTNIFNRPIIRILWVAIGAGVLASEIGFWGSVATLLIVFGFSIR